MEEAGQVEERGGRGWINHEGGAAQTLGIAFHEDESFGGRLDLTDFVVNAARLGPLRHFDDVADHTDRVHKAIHGVAVGDGSFARANDGFVRRAFINRRPLQVGGEGGILCVGHVDWVGPGGDIAVAGKEPEFNIIGHAHGRVAVADDGEAVVGGIELPGDEKLFLIVEALDAAGGLLRASECGQEESGQYGDDRDDDEQLDEGEREGA